MTMPEPVDITPRKKGSGNVERQILPADSFKLEDTNPEERGSIRKTRGERTAQQQAVDVKVLQVWREWRDCGKPDDWLDMPVKKWPVEPRYIDDALFMLGKGASLHGKKLVVGTITDRDENGVRYP